MIIIRSGVQTYVQSVDHTISLNNLNDTLFRPNLSRYLKFGNPSDEVSIGDVSKRAGGCGKDSGDGKAFFFYFMPDG